MLDWVFTEDEKQIIISLLIKGKEEQSKNDKFAIIDFESFYKLFNEDEIEICKKYLSINPKNLNYKLPYLGLVDVPKNIVAIPNQEYEASGKKEILVCQYLPKEVLEAYVKLNEAMQSQIDKKLLVLYGYRSPPRQVFMFFDILQGIYDFDFNKTVKRVCFPAYSEHVYPKKQAMDFVTQTGIKGEGFEKTLEYKWLQENAEKFGFIESYPKDNNLDMMWESWHWCLVK
jgi:hypothetical protein